LVGGCKLVDRVILAGKNKYLSHILKERPDVIALGYDQSAYVKELKRDLKKLSVSDEDASRIEVIRLKPYKETIYKNHLLKKKREI
jgi:glycerol-3-phosphate cytidylyltransferase-like family protein